MGHIACVYREIADAGAFKAKVVLLLFRLSTLWQSRNPFWRLLAIPFVILNKLINECFFCVEIPHRARIGYGLRLYHPHCIVIGRDVVIGRDCILRQGVTVGNITLRSGAAGCSPVLGDNVELGAHACIIGDVHIGNNTRIGAGTVVTKNLADGATAIGARFRVVVKPNEPTP